MYASSFRTAGDPASSSSSGQRREGALPLVGRLCAGGEPDAGLLGRPDPPAELLPGVVRPLPVLRDLRGRRIGRGGEGEGEAPVLGVGLSGDQASPHRLTEQRVPQPYVVARPWSPSGVARPASAAPRSAPTGDRPVTGRRSASVSGRSATPSARTTAHSSGAEVGEASVQQVGKQAGQCGLFGRLRCQLLGEQRQAGRSAGGSGRRHPVSSFRADQLEQLSDLFPGEWPRARGS